MRNKKIAITSDKGLDQRLIAILAKICNIKLIAIPREIIADEYKIFLSKDQIMEKYGYNHLEKVKKTMQNVDGIILPGNKYDIHPTHYGQSNIHSETQKKINHNPYDIRFEVEKEMLLTAIQRQIPIVAICGGMQLVNVVLGGSLTQHLPDNPNSIMHRPHHQIEKEIIANWEKEFKNHILTGNAENIYTKHSHNIKIKTDSTLGKIYKQYNSDIDLANIAELSIHHQGVFKKNLADSLKTTAASKDGLIEAVELIDYPSSFIATQYHFEYNVGNAAYGIFKELL